jgi:hypothetical protein
MATIVLISAVLNSAWTITAEETEIPRSRAQLTVWQAVELDLAWPWLALEREP